MIDIRKIKKLSLSIIDNELTKLTPEDQIDVCRFCLETAVYRKLHVLFTQSELVDFTEKVFMNVNVRDFVLDLTDKLSVQLDLGKAREYALERYLSETLSYHDNAQSIDKDLVLIPPKVFSNMAVSKDDIFLCLSNNKWLVSIILINLYFFESSFFKEAEVQ